MRCKTAGELYDVIDRIAPFSTQCEWDNSGLLVGSADSKVNRIGVVLDITVEAIEKARSLGIDTIVAHHPVIFAWVMRCGNHNTRIVPVFLNQKSNSRSRHNT